MKRALLIVLTLIIAGGSNAFAEIRQSERFKRRMDQSVKASADREHDRQLENEAALPVPKPAVTNVDVQAVLAKTEYKTFAQAKAAEAKRVVDGEPLWLYIKFNGKLGDYVITTRDPEDREHLRYTMYAEVGPRGDVTALSRYTLRFTKEELALPEIKIALAPALFGHNKSIPVFLMASGDAKTGVWNNEIRITNDLTVPRSPSANLAIAPVTLDFAGGTSKYKKMDSEYDSVILRGNTDIAKLPIAGTFYNDDVKSAIVEKLMTEKIVPVKFYFSGEDWQEFSSGGFSMERTRRVFATFTYLEGQSCLYGLAEVRETFDSMEEKFGNREIRIEKGLPAACADAS